MIDFLHEWIEQIAIAIIIASIFEMILPNGKTKKYIKMILGVFIVFNMISPFVNGSSLNDLNSNNIIGNYTDNITVDDTQSQHSIDDKIEELYIRELEQDISTTVEKQGYTVDKCEIEAVIYSDNEEAGISRINIKILSKNNNYLEQSKESNIEEVNQVEIEVNINNTNKEEDNNSSITEKDIKRLRKYLSNYYEIDKDIININ